MTQHHHTPPPDPMPLDPEERALAERLARLGPRGEPSAALDARVLAAAHAATAGRHGVRGGRRRARWPIGVGVAASVVLAAGIAWQMRPLPAPASAPESAVAAASVAAPASDSAPATAAAAATATAAAPAVARTAKALAPPPPEAPPVVFDEPAPMDVAALPPPPAPPPPSPPAPPAPAVAPAPVAAPQAAAMAARAAPAPEASADTGESDAPEEDVPPATAASPQVRDAWLARIRELAADGRDDEARASLAEFRHRYPAFAIPDDLRPLLPPATQAPLPTPPR